MTVEATDGSPVMSFVGGGRGDYVQETTYRYVGRGAGEFEAVMPQGISGGSIGLKFTAVFGSLLLVVYVVCAAPTVAVVTTTPAPFDCEAGAANWQLAWSADKQQYCCQLMGRGCSTSPPALLPFSTLPAAPPPSSPQPSTVAATLPPPAPTIAMLVTQPPTPEPYDCNVGGVGEWSSEKKVWCCLHYRNGCPTLLPPPTPPPVPYDCAAGVANWQAGWSVDKKDWCCSHTGKGCPPAGGCETTERTTAAPFDCIAGFANWEVEWSQAKRAWCCERYSRGCSLAAPCLRKRK